MRGSPTTASYSSEAVQRLRASLSRFDLRLNPHLHQLALDGVFLEDDSSGRVPTAVAEQLTSPSCSTSSARGRSLCSSAKAPSPVRSPQNDRQQSPNPPPIAPARPHREHRAGEAAIHPHAPHAPSRSAPFHDTLPRMGAKTRQLRLKKGSSDKFWRATLSGRTWTVSWGRTGTAGQSKSYQLDTKADASADFERKVAEKLAKGYVDAKSSGPSKSRLKSTASPRAKAVTPSSRKTVRSSKAAPALAKQRARIERMLSRAGIDEPSIAALTALIRPAILLRSFKATKADLALGATRVGGTPDLPEKFRWPKDARFVAQIRLQDVTPYDSEGVLPRDGWLLVFSDIWVDHVTVRYFPAKTRLLPSTPPAEEPSVAPGVKIAPSVARGVKIVPELHLPPPESAFVSFASKKPTVGSAKRLGSLLALEPDVHDRYQDVWNEWYEVLRPADPYGGYHQLLGYGHGMVEQKKNERVLFAFDTDIHAKMSWGDEQSVFLFVPERALSAGKLERVRVGW